MDLQLAGIPVAGFGLTPESSIQSPGLPAELGPEQKTLGRETQAGSQYLPPPCPRADSPCQASRCPWIPGLYLSFPPENPSDVFLCSPPPPPSPPIIHLPLSLRSRIRERRSSSEQNASSKKPLNLANRNANETWNRASMCHKPRIFVPQSPTQFALPTSVWGRPCPWCKPVRGFEVLVTCMYAAWFLPRTTCVCACSRVCGGQYARSTARRVRRDARGAAACSSLAGEGGL